MTADQGMKNKAMRYHNNQLMDAQHCKMVMQRANAQINGYLVLRALINETLAKCIK